MADKIKTFSTVEFIDAYMEPDQHLQEILQEDYGRFFIVRVQDLIRLSKLPIPPTRALTHTIIYLTSGIATMKVGFEQTIIHGGECLVVPAGKVFSYDQYEINTGFICVFDSDFLVEKIGNNNLLREFEFLNTWGNPIIKPDHQTVSHLSNTFQRILDAYFERGLANSTIIQAYFIAALCDLNAAYQPLIAHKSKSALLLTNKFKALLPLKIRRNHRVSDYATLLNVSPNHLNKTIKEVTRKSASKWIEETLMIEAKVLLFQTQLSVTEITNTLGMDDPSYFSRLFKKHEGVTPLVFRKKIEKS